MHVHFFQHASFEGPGRIGEWISERKHSLSGTHFYRGDAVPAPDEIDWLVVMGGPMNVYEYREHPWLRDEKRILEAVIAQGKPVLGVCLGAQLIADVLGSKVYQNAEMEIGWLPVHFREDARSIRAFEKFPDQLTPLHWHGDTYDLPRGATWVAESDACAHQAFTFGEKVIGLQFHIEVVAAELPAFMGVESCELPKGRFVQNRDEILNGSHHLPQVHASLGSLLEALEQEAL